VPGAAWLRHVAPAALKAETSSRPDRAMLRQWRGDRRTLGDVAGDGERGAAEAWISSETSSAAVRVEVRARDRLRRLLGRGGGGCRPIRVARAVTECRRRRIASSAAPVARRLFAIRTDHERVYMTASSTVMGRCGLERVGLLRLGLVVM
jgi:hypothetical protein